MAELAKSEWTFRIRAALAWIANSIRATGGHGSAHSYALFRGWEKAYPETTGYLIETLFDFGDWSSPEISYRQLAFDCAQWLETIQLPSGAFAGLLAGHREPSVFNSGQILFGLLKCEKKEAATRVAAWLLAIQEADGSWKKAAYKPGFEPSYYTRVIWPLLLFERQYPHVFPALKARMRQSLQRYATRFLPNHSIKDWGFAPGKPAFTHTIAYTLEGFWMSALLLEETAILEKTLASLQTLLKHQLQKKRTAGAFDENWRGDYRFLCPTGNAQLSLLCHRIWEHVGDSYYAQAADHFLMEMLPAQSLSRFPATNGAISGSLPVWGKYQRLRYPNWACKFFLDAMRLYGIRNF